jgi:dolichol-phosphate mannosyltransferase
LSAEPSPSPDTIEARRSPRLVVSLCTYNEAENLSPLVRAIRKYAPDADVLVIDDNSPDGTGRVADQLVEEFPWVHVIHRSGKLGLGTAAIEGMKFAIRGGYDLILNLDADFSHPPRFIPDLLAGMKNHDVMIGSRYVPGGGIDSSMYDAKRKLMSWGINTYAKVLLGLPSKDNSGSYRCYRVSRLAELDLDAIRSRGYSFLEEVLYLCRRVGCRIGETPITFEDRRAGASKINTAEVVRALEVILRLGLSRPFRRDRPKSNQDGRTAVRA